MSHNKVNCRIYIFRNNYIRTISNSNRNISKYFNFITSLPFSRNTTNELKIENPQTYDGIVTWIILGFFSMGGIVGAIVYRKKKYN